jgi:hypothetical protein
MWLYREWTGNAQRDSFESAVHAFMNRGSRFTAEDGAKLRSRIEDIEQQLESQE